MVGLEALVLAMLVRFQRRQNDRAGINVLFTESTEPGLLPEAKGAARWPPSTEPLLNEIRTKPGGTTGSPHLRRWQNGEPVRTYDTRWLAYLQEQLDSAHAEEFRLLGTVAPSRALFMVPYEEFGTHEFPAHIARTRL